LDAEVYADVFELLTCQHDHKADIYKWETIDDKDEPSKSLRSLYKIVVIIVNNSIKFEQLKLIEG